MDALAIIKDTHVKVDMKLEAIVKEIESLKKEVASANTQWMLTRKRIFTTGRLCANVLYLGRLQFCPKTRIFPMCRTGWAFFKVYV
jgi:hypothetical protein